MNKSFALALCLALSPAWAFSLKTEAEKSGWKKTGRAKEALQLCYEFARKHPQQVQCHSYGKTPEGREMTYLSVNEARGNTVVWVQAGIHAGEIDGKDAVFWLLREWVEDEISRDTFKNVNLIFIPIVNIDGHERFGAWNRPNQVGPQEMGWRTTGQNLNMNRDFTKADAPEMQALIKLWRQANPALSLDLHVTDGAQFVPEVGVVVLPTANYGHSQLHEAGTKLEQVLMEKLKARGRNALPFYPSFEEDDNPASGFGRYVSTPRFSQAYWSNRHRLGMLVETHSWKDYATRVRTHHDVVLSVIEAARDLGKSWVEAGERADQAPVIGTIPLEYTHNDKHGVIEFAGYRYTAAVSPVSGAKVIRYFPQEPQVWKVPFYEELVPSLSVEAPTEGYLVPPAEAHWLRPRLATHGIFVKPWTGGTPKGLKTFRATESTVSATSFEGHQTLEVKGDWKEEARSIPEGTLFVPIAQPAGRLIMQLLEPRAKDSYLAWGFFNRWFEKKEYMESYVAEDVASEMLEKDPKLKAEFEGRLKADKAFAADPAQRWEFFYRRHPSWDERYQLYPVYKL